MLAQTCSQIGADSPNSKLLTSSEKTKSTKSDSARDKTSPLTVNNNISSETQLKSSFKPYESTVVREKTRSPEDCSSSSSNGNRVRTPVASKSNSNTPNGSGRCASNQSAVSPRTSPAVVGRKTPATPSENSHSSNENTSSSSTKTSEITTLTSSSKSVTTPSVLTSSSDPSLKDLPLGTFKPGALPPSSAFLGAGYPAPGLPHPMDLMASSLMSHHALKSGALSPYLSYARMKNSSGTDTLVPVCRDPYCTGCSLSSHLLGASNPGAKTPTSCPAGCTQCDHVSKAPSYLGHSPAAAAYAHAQLAALAAASQLPYVCNWIAGDAAYCGKRFSTSEELLQHLRTHTSLASVSESSAALSMLNSPQLPPTHPLLHRTYPTPPLSPLATARYHPYSKPSLLPPSLAASSLASFPLGHPSLSPYSFPPYSLYGPRLGAASSMHP